MCNLVIKLQVSYQFPRRRSQVPEQQQGSPQVTQQLPQQLPQQQQHQQQPPAHLTSANSAAQCPSAAQAASNSLGGSAALRPQNATIQHSSERGEGQQLAAGHQHHHGYSMAAAPSHSRSLGPHWQRWPHHDGGPAHLPHQEACLPHSPDAESASAQHEGHRHAQLAAVTRPSRLWGFAASGVDLSRHAPSEQAQLPGLTWQGPGRLGQAGASPAGDSLPASDTLPHAISMTHHQSGSCSSALGQDGTSQGDETQAAPQGVEVQWVMVNYNRGREQQRRWSPAMIVRRMMTRARRRRAESQPGPGSLSAQANLADAASTSA